jgi:hypothetical protein
MNQEPRARNQELQTDAESPCPPICNLESAIWNAYRWAGMSICFGFGRLS